MTVAVIEHADRAALAAATAARVAADLGAVIARRGGATLAVPGGATPAAFLGALGRHALNWAAVAVMPTDERWTPPEDARSNAAMIRRALAPARPRLIPFWRAGLTPEAAATRLSAALSPLLPPDVCVLGMGADMHCASLFPGAAGLGAAMASGAAPVMAMDPPGAVERRVTLTAPALAGAGRLILLIAGDEKRAALEKALASGDPLAAPVAGVLACAAAPEIHWAP